MSKRGRVAGSTNTQSWILSGIRVSNMVNQMATAEKDLSQRTRQLEERIVDARSPISIDSLLDSLIALTYDSEGLKKTKNFDSFFTKCE